MIPGTSALKKNDLVTLSTDGVVVPVALAKLVSYVGMSGRPQQRFHTHVLFAQEYGFKLTETISRFV